MKRLRGITKLWAIALAVLLTAQMAVPSVEAAEKTAEKIPEKTIDADSKAGKSGAAVKVGDEIIYRITYKNDTEAKQDIVITDTLSAGLEFVSASNEGKNEKGAVTWKLKDVEAGKTGAVTLTVKVKETDKETVGNKATVKVGDKDPVSTSAVTSKVEKAATAPAPDSVPETQPAAETPQPDTQEAAQVENQEEQKPEVTPEPEVKVQTTEKKVETSVTTTPGTEAGDTTGGGGEPCNHTYDWEITKPATCNEEGERVQKCTKCGDIVEDSAEKIDIDKNVHKFEEITVAATCTKEGKKSQVCADCGAVKEGSVEVIKAAGHEFDKWKTTKVATCTEDGEKVKVCTVCDEPDKTSAEKIDATGHDFSEWKIEEAATCAKEGTKSRICKNCGKVENAAISKTDHDWETTYTVDKAPGKTTKGSKSIHCKNCNATKDAKEIPATGDHSVSGLKSGTTYARGSKITFTVKGIGMDNASPIKGDVRYVPVKWSVNPEGTWEKAPYTASFTLSKNGDYTLKVTYDKEEFNGEKWVKTGDTDTTSVSFKIGDVKNTSKTAAKNTTKKGVPKTADTAPYASLIGLLLISGFISIYVIKKQTKNK